MLERLLHEQYETADGAPVLFECRECGYRSQSLGSLHAHVEGHWGLLQSLTWHCTHLLEDAPAAKWMDSTRVVAVRDVEEIPLSEVEGL